MLSGSSTDRARLLDVGHAKMFFVGHSRVLAMEEAVTRLRTSALLPLSLVNFVLVGAVRVELDHVGVFAHRV